MIFEDILIIPHKFRKILLVLVVIKKGYIQKVVCEIDIEEQIRCRNARSIQAPKSEYAKARSGKLTCIEKALNPLSWTRKTKER